MLLGIDLGTTFSVGAYVDAKGNVKIINSSEGSSTIPSVVLFDNDKQIVVGEVAKDSAIIRADDVVSVVKNYMGKKVALKNYSNRDYTPEMISSFILRKVIGDAEAYTGDKVEGVVVTVPAYFTDSQRKATEDAVIMTGVPLIGMINEPTAAALSYIHENSIRNEKILIYDLGGGTFDVTILDVKDNKEIDVLSTGGLSNAGGRFFDQSIVDFVRDIIEEKHDIDLEDDEYADELQELYHKAENAKIQLSSRTKTQIPIKIGSIKETVELTRDQFDQMIKKTYVRTEGKIKQAIEDAKLSTSDINKVLLVGGSSRIPFVIDSISRYMGTVPSKDINPDEAVAMGAAIYASMSEKNGEILFQDVCSHSIGIPVLNDNNKLENEIIIKKNSKLPISKEQRYRTATAGQRKIDLTITEGEFKELTDVTILGNFEVFLPPDLPDRTLVLISVSLDVHQLVHIRISLPDHGIEEEYHMKRIANLDEAEVKEITGILRDYSVE